MSDFAESEATPEITIRACKYDGLEHRRWHARLISRQGSLVVLDARFDRLIKHALLGTILPGTISVEYYWLDRWYNVFRFHEPTGELHSYYCNVNVPPVFDGQVLSYVDLDMDILVAPDLSYSIVDQDEFEANSALFHYPAEVRDQAHAALSELVALIESRQFPFDYEE
jgi:protein associated with RNAse G/E